jgi:hypothetical protein
MARPSKKDLLNLSLGEIKAIMAAKAPIAKLEARKEKLQAEMAKVEEELEKLVAGFSLAPARKKRAKKKVARKRVAKKRTAKKAGRKKVVAKKTARRKVARKKTVKKAAAKKAPRRKVARKKAGKKAARKKAPARQQPTLEDVIVAVIKKNRGKMAFQDILAAIQKGKLFKTRSKNFSNVLRRTVSTSKKVKRVGRGLYAAG